MASDKTQLKSLNTTNIPDNSTGEINPSNHRTFNEALVDSVYGGILSISGLKDFDTTELNDGDKVEVLGYYTKGDGGEGIFYWDSTSTDSEDGGVTIIPTHGGFGGTGRWKRENTYRLDEKKFGAVADGVTDDTTNIQAFIDYAIANNIRSIKFSGSDQIKISQINITDSLWVDFADTSLVGTSGNEFIEITASNVRILNLKIGSELAGIGASKNGIIIDTSYVDQNNYNELKDFVFNNINFYGNDDTQIGIQIDPGASEIKIINSRFIQSATMTRDTTGASGVVVTASGGATSLDWRVDLIIQGCFFENWFYGYRNGGDGYTNFTQVKDCVFKDCFAGLRAYHAREFIMTGCHVSGCSQEVYLWRASMVTNNQFTDFDAPHIVELEAFDIIIANNEFTDNIGGNGVYLQGGGAYGQISDNYIFNVKGSGIYCDTKVFGGQFRTTAIKDNKILDCGHHGIHFFEGKARDVVIQDNQIAGIGQNCSTEFDITAGASASGTITFTYDSNSVAVEVTNGDSTSEVAQKIENAIRDDGTITLTCITSDDNIWFISDTSGSGESGKTISFVDTDTTGVTLDNTSKNVTQQSNGIYFDYDGDTGSQLTEGFVMGNVIQGVSGGAFSDALVAIGVYLSDSGNLNASSLQILDNIIKATIPVQTDNNGAVNILVNGNRVTNKDSISVVENAKSYDNEELSYEFNTQEKSVQAINYVYERSGHSGKSLGVRINQTVPVGDELQVEFGIDNSETFDFSFSYVEVTVVGGASSSSLAGNNGLHKVRAFWRGPGSNFSQTTIEQHATIIGVTIEPTSTGGGDDYDGFRVDILNGGGVAMNQFTVFVEAPFPCETLDYRAATVVTP